MWTGSVFWAVLAAVFLGLAWTSYRGRENLPKVTHPYGTEPGMAQSYVTPAVARALGAILTVEFIGFAAAAAAALWSAFV